MRLGPGSSSPDGKTTIARAHDAERTARPGVGLVWGATPIAHFHPAFLPANVLAATAVLINEFKAPSIVSVRVTSTLRGNYHSRIGECHASLCCALAESVRLICAGGR